MDQGKNKAGFGSFQRHSVKHWLKVRRKTSWQLQLGSDTLSHHDARQHLSSVCVCV